MTIAGDLQGQVAPFLKSDGDADKVVALVMAFLSDANTVSFLRSRGVHVGEWYAAVDVLREKLLPGLKGQLS